ncbi:TPA: hypothetical protein ACY3LZ_002110 [Citrobacter freundii]|uniref:hypothetical protein n=1 Tax=Enterobacteriaceae TaxID=543 RepID=UPI000669616D|nr:MULTISPECIES: hypothetical protein [Enterobacteriaceae]EGT5208828.1 hypothetical protein [Cronobacter sakazakii]HBT9662825.1 hypothetical protein [Klebsiella pneumoniae]EGT5754141.1 hypothetical protein [Cronobacter sakazakii]EJG0817137.1 hypothetical protein [Cronobacter sakazakii]EJG2181163.1 hypothetical protein [Cronobacter sakazakii]
MKIQAAIALILSAASLSAEAGNWAVKNGWCQTMTDNGQALVMLKNNTLSVFGQLQGCPNGPQELMGSRISVNGNLVPTSQLCNQQTGFKAVEVEGGQATTAAKKAIVSIAGQETSTVQVFGAQLTFTRGDMMTVCPKYVPALASATEANVPQINKGSVMKAAKQAYTKEYDSETAEAADFGSYEVKGNTVVFEVYNAGYRTYDKVVVNIGADGKATSAKVEYMGK